MGLAFPKEWAAASGTHVLFAGSSEAGQVRAVNQDSFFVGEFPRGVLAVVADGMGGHQTGEVASQKAVQIVKREFERSRAHPPAAIARAVQIANNEVYLYARTHKESYGMGTTLTAVFLDDQIGLVGHVGDSRAYLIRDGEVRQLTRDHSWVADRVRQGLLSEGEARHHHWRNVITNALGAMPEIKLDVSHFEVAPGDRLLLCSDGLTMLCSNDMLAKTIREHPPKEAVRRLLAEANERGSPDNVTAVVLNVGSLEPKPKPYTLPPKQDELESIRIGNTMSGVRRVEEAFPATDWVSKLRRHALFPYRFWVMGCLYLVLLFMLFSLR